MSEKVSLEGHATRVRSVNKKFTGTFRAGQVIKITQYVWQEAQFNATVGKLKEELSDTEAEKMALEALGMRRCACWLGNIYCKCEG